VGCIGQCTRRHDPLARLDNDIALWLSFMEVAATQEEETLARFDARTTANGDY
jgi:hypothetical protein